MAGLKKIYILILTGMVLLSCKARKDVYLFTSFNEPANAG